MIQRLLFGWMLMGLAFAAPAAAQDAQSGEPYFHEAAQQYLNEQTDAALQTVNAGLRVAPDNAKLQALREKLKQQKQQQQSGGGSSGGGSSSDQQDAGSQSPEGDQNDDSDQQTPEGSSEADEQSERSDQERRQSEQSQNSNQDGTPRDAEAEPGDRQRPTDQLTRAQAERILQALANQEEQLLRQLQQHGSSEQRVKKDW